MPARVCHQRVVAAACAVLALGSLAGCGARDTAPPPAVQAFPSVPLASLNGKAAFSPAALRGKAAVINFWATWCEPCRKEMPSLQRLQQQADASQLTVIAITVDTDLNLAREFVLQHQLGFAHYADSEQKLARGLLGITAFPATFVVDAEGNIRARVAGARDWASSDALRLLETALGAPVTPK